MKTVLDRPMASHQLHQTLRTHRVPAQARDQVACFASALYPRLGDFMIDTKDQIDARKMGRLTDVIDLRAFPDPESSGVDLTPFFSTLLASGVCSGAS
jgi:hypothetical protein